MKRNSFVRLTVVIACLAVFVTGCSRDPNVRKQKYYESGDRYFAKGKYREAVIEYRNATDVDATFGDAHYKLAECYLKLLDGQRAYSEYSRTVELQPDNYAARVSLAHLLIANGTPDSLKLAQDHVDVLIEKRPNDADTHITHAELLGKQDKFGEAIAEMQKAATIAPQRGDIYLDLASLQAHANLPDQAEANLKKAIDLQAGKPARVALAAFYQSRRRFPEAEQQMQQVIAENPKDPDLRLELARLYMSQGKRAEAENFLRQVKQDFPNDSAGYRMLGDYYFATGDLDKALAEYAALHNDHPKDLQVEKNYIQLLIAKDRIDEASKLNEGILKSKAKDPDALTYKGEIQLHRGNASDAAQTLQAVVSENPNAAPAHYQLGLALSATGDLDRAAAEFREALRVKPSMVEAQRMLALYSMQKGDMQAMEAAASAIISLQPGAPDGYALRAVSLMSRKQFAGAEKDAHKAIEVAPQSIAGYVQMGNSRALQQKYADAENWYNQALNHDANAVDALRGLMNVYILQKKFDNAVAAANKQIAKSPNNSVFYAMLGKALSDKKDDAKAKDALGKAIQLNKNNTDAYVTLTQVQIRNGALDDALASCNNGLRDNPREYRLQMLEANVYEKKQDLEKAKVAYQAALQIKPNDPLASNNYAYVLLETNGNPDLALQLAQTARRALPELSNVADTLGWAFYQKGVYASAINMFQEAMSLSAKHKEPESALYHYHLGMAYAKTRQPALAKQQLERALKIDPKYADAADVRKQLAELKS
jgi:tetratricopeptide (TPR) repeat protein